MKKTILIEKIILAVCIVFSMISCGTLKSHKETLPVHKNVVASENLSADAQRRYDYFYLEALRLKEKGEYDAAFDLLNHCVSINPNGAASLYELFRFYMYMKQPENAEKALKKAVKISPDNYWYKQTLASYYQDKGLLPEAIYVFEDMSTQFSTRLEPLISLVDLYNRTKDYDQVIATLNRLEGLDGKSEQISMEKFRMYLNKGDDVKAFTEIENLAKEYPYDMRYMTILGDVYLNNGKSEKAYDTYMKVLQKEPGYAPAMLSLASYYEKQGNDSLYQNQIDSVLLNESLDSNSKLDIMRGLIVKSEQTDKDSIKIASLFNSMLMKKQENADIAMLAAQYMLSKNMNKESVPILNMVLEIDPENTPARLQLLNFALKEENAEKIIDICKRAIEYTPEVLEYYYYLGLSYHQKEMTDEALSVFKKGVGQVTSTSDKNIASDFYAIMGDLYHVKGMNKEAYAAYDSSLVYKADNIGALNNYAYYLSVEKTNLDKAEEMSYRTVKAEPTNGTYLDTYAWILFEKGKYSEAKIYIDQALINDGDKSSVVVEHAGDIYAKNGDIEKAVQYWDKAYKLAQEGDSDNGNKREVKELNLLKKKIAQKKYLLQ